MVELNREQLLDELSSFEKKKNVSDIPDILNKYLESVAENGDTIFPWNKLQPLLRRKLELVMNDFNEKCPTDHLMQLPNVKQFDFDELKGEILEAIDGFPSAPFTIQRLCELVTNPSKHYKRTDKFMRGIEKNILVVSTIEPKSAIGDDSHFVSTSSFKNLFSSLHSSMNSLQSSSSTSASTSLLVNGIADVITCDNQMSIHSTNDDMMSDPKHNLNKCPVSPTSLPLSPTTNSPPSQHLPPLQQLDSFTTVFASSPSTPLSVVSDLHSYEQSSSLSLVMSSTSCPKSPKENPSYTVTTNDSKDTENAATFESTTTSPHSELDSSVTSNTPQADTSTTNDSNDEIKEEQEQEQEQEQDFTSKSLSDFNESEALDKNQTQTDSKISEDFSQSENNENNSSTNNNDSNDNDNIIDSSLEPSNDNIVTESEDISPKTKSISDDITSSDNQSNQESKPSIEDFPNSSKTQSETIESSTNQMRSKGDDEDMSSPMDYCGSNNGTNSSDFVDKTPELTPDCNIMDETLSQSDQSDQSEPMDED